MKPVFHSLIIFACLFLQACPDRYDPNPDIQYNIVNKSPQKIYIGIDFRDSIVTSKEYTESPLMYIKSGDTLRMPGHSEIFQLYKLNILIFDHSKIKRYSWQEIQEGDLVDKRYVLTLDELKAMNYTIVYVGN